MAYTLSTLTKRSSLTAVLRLSILIGVAVIGFSHPVLAKGPRMQKVNVYNIYGGMISAQTPAIVHPVVVPEKVQSSKIYVLTSYTSLPQLTDSSPFITANGSHVRLGTIAANCLAFGTRVQIPDLFGDQVFVVEDRLAARKPCSMIDVWLPTYAEAKKFGVKRATVNILQ